MFIGEYTHSIDSKGRLAIPAKFRPYLKNGAVVTRVFDNCLFLYTKEEWEKLAPKLSSLPVAPSNVRAFSRLMLGGAMDLKLDKQGRVMLPDYLRKYAGLKKNVIVAGLLNRLEIWDQATWEKYKSETEARGAEIAEHLGGLGV